VGSYENIDAAVADFLFRAKPNLSRSCVAQVAALYCGGNGLAVRVVLVPPSLSSSLRTRSQQWGSVGALEAVIPNEDVTSFVAEIANGRLEGARFRGVLEQDVCFPKLNAWKYDYLGTPARAPDRGFKSIVIRLSPDHQSHGLRQLIGHDKLDELEGKLLSSLPPYGGLGDLLRDWCLGTEINGESKAQIDLVTPFWTRFSEIWIDLKTRVVTVGVDSKWERSNNEAIVTLLQKTGTAESSRQVRQLCDTTWIQSDGADPALWETAFGPLPTDPSPVTVILSYCGERIGEVETGLPSPRITAHLAVDPDFEELKFHLYGWRETKAKNPETRNVESGVAELFTLCGFAAFRSGGFRRSGIFDVFAFLGRRRVAVIECTTTATPPNGKLRDLLARADEVRAALAATNSSTVEVAAVLVVPIPRARLHVPILDPPASSPISVLAQEDLDEMLDMAVRGYTARAIYSKFISTTMWILEEREDE